VTAGVDTVAPATSTVDAPPAMDHRRVLVVLSGLLVGMFLAAVDQTIVATALPTIAGDLGGLDQLSWVVTAYLLTTTACTPLYGKLSDLYGRRLLFQIAIVIFLVGSALSGISQTLWQLVAFRGIQGLGAGGLIAIAFAIIGDVLSPRDRGRYMGYFSAVFALAGVAGPLLGGFAVDHLSWRWIFYVNVPIGLAALVITSSVLHLPIQRRPHQIDYLGAALLVAAVSCVLLVSVWGGNEYAWGSAPIVGLAAAGLVLLVAFLAQERRAAEPILPLRLFRVRTVAVGFTVTALTGGAMFGAVVFLPLFLQVVSGVSATNSGLLLSPLMLSLTVVSIVSGRLISRTGRYRWLAIGGVAILLASMLLLSTIGAGTSHYTVGAFMVLVGAGMGMHMPVLNLSTQNAVPFADLGTATSAVTFSRSLGGAVGVAAFGSVMNARLQDNLAELGLRVSTNSDRLASGPEQIRSLSEPLRSGVVGALADAIASVYLVAVPIVVVALLVCWLLPELPLRQTAHVSVAARPKPRTAEPLVERTLP